MKVKRINLSMVPVATFCVVTLLACGDGSNDSAAEASDPTLDAGVDTIPEDDNEDGGTPVEGDVEVGLDTTPTRDVPTVSADARYDVTVTTLVYVRG